MKFLKSIRFDDSDDHVFPAAAQAGEWAVPGAFEFSNLDDDSITGKLRQAYANGFLGLGSFGRSTFACVSDISDDELEDVTRRLANHFVAKYAAPDAAAATPAAREEVAFVTGLCADVLINTVFTLRRTTDDTGETREEFRKIRAPDAVPSHSPVWSVVNDDA